MSITHDALDLTVHPPPAMKPTVQPPSPELTSCGYVPKRAVRILLEYFLVKKCVDRDANFASFCSKLLCRKISLKWDCTKLVSHTDRVTVLLMKCLVANRCIG